MVVIYETRFHTIKFVIKSIRGRVLYLLSACGLSDAHPVVGAVKNNKSVAHKSHAQGQAYLGYTGRENAPSVRHCVYLTEKGCRCKGDGEIARITLEANNVEGYEGIKKESEMR